MIDDKAAISHLIVHYVLDSTYDMTTLQFSSINVTERALEFFTQNQYQKLCNFLVNADATPLLSGISGNLFEAFAHRALSSGGVFEFRDLDNDNSTAGSITLPKLDVERFSDIGKCKDHQQYFIPWNPNYPCIGINRE